MQALFSLCTIYVAVNALNYSMSSLSIEFLGCENKLSKLHLNSSFSAVTADSKLRWLHSKKKTYFHGAEKRLQPSLLSVPVWFYITMLFDKTCGIFWSTQNLHRWWFGIFYWPCNQGTPGIQQGLMQWQHDDLYVDNIIFVVTKALENSE